MVTAIFSAHYFAAGFQRTIGANGLVFRSEFKGTIDRFASDCPDFRVGYLSAVYFAIHQSDHHENGGANDLIGMQKHRVIFPALVVGST